MDTMVTTCFDQVSQAPPADHISPQSAADVASAYDFFRHSTLVEVGGGHGMLLAAILTAHPDLRGVLFDRPHVVAGAGSIAEAAGVADRCEIIGGDLFRYLPSGASAYLLERIIRDWDDDHAVAILTNCRRAMGQRGTLLLVEAVRPEGGGDALDTRPDLDGPGSPGGRERTEAEYRALFAVAGFTLSRVIPTSSGRSVIEGRPIKGTH